jgi:signal transduction histidine kinase
MFRHARRRLALRYAVVSAIVLAAFSLAFLTLMFLLLQPDFDVGPEVSAPTSEREANARVLERIGLAVVVADGVAVVLVGLSGYHLAGRTLGPIRDAHERQGRFVSDASHEIRTPLAVIRANVDRALAPNADEATRAEALAAISRAATRLGDVAGDLLVLARPEPGSTERTPGVVDSSVIVAEVVEAASAAHPGDPGRLRLALEPDVLVLAEASDLARIVQNLVDNAFAHGQTPIDVRTGIIGGQALIEVCDQGPGIGDEHLARIFEPFYRVRSDADAPPGSGLGLAIVQQLTRRLGGSIVVRTNAASGTCFRLLIPRIR